VAVQITVDLSRPEVTSQTLAGARIAAIVTSFVGIGLSVFLFLTRSWFHFLLFTTVTLCFDILGILLVRKIGWQRLVTRSSSSKSALFLTLFVLWASFLGLYFSGPNFTRLQQEERVARIESSDPSCSPGLLRSLAKQPAALSSATPIQDTAHEPVCTVQSTRVVAGVGSRSCLQLESDTKRESYCRTRLDSLYSPSFESNGIHYGDMIAARTAFGHPSAFLYPSKTFARLLFYPRGEIAATTEDPEQKYSEHLESTFMLLLWYLLLGSVFLIGLVA
jgi:hypothetical protein